MLSILTVLSEELYMGEEVISRFIMTAPYRYKKYKIPKRKPNEFRTISQPSKEVKFMQNLCLGLIREKLPVHKCALAYEKGTSIKKNAELHKNNQYFLKMDFKDFFPSIVPEDLLAVLSDNGICLLDEEKIILSHLFFWKLRRNSPLKLSIGAPSSPFISNAVLFGFDIKVSELCAGLEITYSRYADDLTFTTNKKNILSLLPIEIKKILSSMYGRRLKINEDKTVFSSKKFNRHITGLTITNDGKVSIGRERKRYIRCMVHKFKTGCLPPKDVSKLCGLLAFVFDVEPKFLKRLSDKYGLNTINKIKGIVE